MLAAVDRITTPDSVERFDTSKLTFVEEEGLRVQGGEVCSGKPGLYRLNYENPSGEFQLTVHYDPARTKERRLLRGEWYGLRFLAVHQSRKYLKAIWRSDGGGVLAVPNRQRWPLLYERALVLATGILPARMHPSGLLCYHGIPLNLAQTIASRLGVAIEQQESTAS
jgi:hypothetical protein